MKLLDKRIKSLKKIIFKAKVLVLKKITQVKTQGAFLHM